MTTLLIIGTGILSVMAFNNPSLMYKLIFNPWQIQERKEYYRFLTSGFLHANWMHLIVNMFVLYIFGGTVEAYYTLIFGEVGPYVYVGMYLLAIICSSIYTFFKYREYPHYNSLGASGAVSAVVFVAILAQPFAMLYLYFILPIPGIVAGILYLVYSAYMSKKGGDNINHDAHFYGAIFGLLFTIVLYPDSGIMFIQQLLAFFNIRI